MIECQAATCKHKSNATNQQWKIFDKCSSGMFQQPICGMRTNNRTAQQSLEDAMKSVDFLPCKNSSEVPTQLTLEGRKKEKDRQREVERRKRQTDEQ